MKHPYIPESAVNPDHVFALWKFHLISDEEAEAAYEAWDADCKEWESRFAAAGEAWKQRPWWRRLLGTGELAWKFRWMDEHA
jgi:hypothetical protein